MTAGALRSLTRAVARRWADLRARTSALLRVSSVRYSLLALVAAAVLIAAMTQMASVIVDQWSQRDVELRARLVYRSIRERVAMGLAAKPERDLEPFFEQLVEDERLQAVGFCNPRGQMLYATKEMPSAVHCPEPPLPKVDTFDVFHDEAPPIAVAIFPLSSKESEGSLMVVHDLSYIERRAHEAEFYMALALIGVAAGLGLLGTVIVLALLKGWNQSLRQAIANFNLGRANDGPRQMEMPIGRDIEAMLSELRLERKYADSIHVEWSPKTLHQLLDQELPGAQVIVVSNREPYIHNRADGRIVLQTPASGLVAALEPVMRACGGVWVAHGSGSADRETVDGMDRVAVPPDAPAYALRRVWISDEEQDGYYYGLANEGLWPLCHIAFVRPTFRERDWAQYAAVNQRFADVIIEEADRDDPIVLVQDYHFALLPRMLRRRLPRATISRSGIFRGRIRRRSAFARGGSRSSMDSSGAPSSASTPSSIATTSSRRSIASWRAASTASEAR